MATLKYYKSITPAYKRILEYLVYQPKDSNSPARDANGSRLSRKEYYLDGIHCEPFCFDLECRQLNALYHKNQDPEEAKFYHFIIAFDRADASEHGLDGPRAQKLGMEYARLYLPGFQTLVCTHVEGRHGNQNIHVHLVINGLRMQDVERQPFMQAETHSRAGYKVCFTNLYFYRMRRGLMELTEREGLEVDDLFRHSPVRITSGEYYAQLRGQERLNEQNRRILEDGMKPRFTQFRTQKQIIRDAVTEVSASACSPEELRSELRDRYQILLWEENGRLQYRTPDAERPFSDYSLGTAFGKVHLLSVLEENAKAAVYDPERNYEEEPEAILRIRSELPLVTQLQQRIRETQQEPQQRKEMTRTVCTIQAGGYGSVEELNAAAAERKAECGRTEQDLRRTQGELNQTEEQFCFTSMYLSNRSIPEKYEKAKNKERFLKEHKTEVDEYRESVKYIKAHMNGRAPTLAALRQKQSELHRALEELREKHDTELRELQQLEDVCLKVKRILTGEETAHGKDAEEQGAAVKTLEPEQPSRAAEKAAGRKKRGPELG